MMWSKFFYKMPDWLVATLFYGIGGFLMFAIMFWT